MHDEVRMRFRDRTKNIEKQPDSCRHIEPAFVAIPVTLGTLDIFQHKIGLPGCRNSRVDKFRDVRMSQQPENSPFALESGFPRLSHERDVEKFHGEAALEASVVAFGEPD